MGAVLLLAYCLIGFGVVWLVKWLDPYGRHDDGFGDYEDACVAVFWPLVVAAMVVIGIVLGAAFVLCLAAQLFRRK